MLEILSSPRFDTKTASSSDLFLKTLFLTALASGNRLSELAAVTRSGLRLTKEEAFLPTRPDFLFKNQTSKHFLLTSHSRPLGSTIPYVLLKP